MTPIFYDKDGNDTKEPLDADYTDLGSGLPKVTAGLTINLDWKNWNLLVFASGAFGQTTYMFYDSAIGSYNKLTYFTADRWTPTNKNGTRPAANAGNNYTNWLYSSANVVRSDYVKIKQIQLGYNLPKSFLDKMNRFQTFKWTRMLAAAAVMLLVSVTSLFAQQRVTVSGVVLDENNLPMIGVGVMQKGTSNGVATD